MVFAELESEITVSNLCVKETHLCPVDPPRAGAGAPQVRKTLLLLAPGLGVLGARGLQHFWTRAHDRQAAQLVCKLP